MSYFKNVSIKGRPALKHVDADGRGDLLIIMPPIKGGTSIVMPDYAKSLYDRVFEMIEPKIGAWKSVVVVPCNERVGEIVKRHDPTHVMLVGRQFSKIIADLGKFSADTNTFGLLVTHKGRRWIQTQHPAVYGVGDQAHWKQASLLGLLYRHVELLRVGLPGWDEPNAPFNYRLVKNEDDWDALRKRLKKRRLVAIDTETTSLRRIGNTVLTIQFGFDGQTGWVLPVAHPGSELSPSLLKQILSFLRKYFERGRRSVHVFVNAPFDIHQLVDLLKLRWYNHEVYDCQTAAFNIDENTMFRKMAGYGKGEFYTLERMALEFGMNHYQHTKVGKGDRTRLRDLPIEQVAEYGAADVVLPIRLMRMQIALTRWRDEQSPEKPYRRFVECVTEVGGRKLQQFVFMERNGLLVDKKYAVYLQGPSSPVLKEIRDEEEKFKSLPEVIKADEMLKKQSNVRSRSGGLFGKAAAAKVASAFQPSKPAHQALLFFDLMKLVTVNKTKLDKASVDDAFKKKYEDNPVVKAFSKFEEAKKMMSTFVVGYYKLLVKKPDNADGRLRTRYGSLFVVTDRSSSNEPNLQNIPTRNKAKAKIIKRQFVAAKGRLMLKRDFSAHEVRMWGVASGDPKIGDVFWNGMQVRLRYEMQRSIPKEKEKYWQDELSAADVHRQNVNLFYGTDPRKVDEKVRNNVKRVIFGAVYGKGIKALAKDIKDTEEKAQELWTLIFRKKFKQGGDWLLRTQKRASRTLIAKNVLGGVRHLYGYLHTNRTVHGAMNRRGPNSIVQGPSSNVGYEGGYFTRKLIWDLYESRGVTLGYLQCNAVHDSTEAECDIVNIPLVEYLAFHGYTTMVHIWMKKTFDVDLKVGFEMDSEVGGSLAAMRKAPRYDMQIDAIASGIEWGNKELGWGLDLDAYMKRVKHNAHIIFDIRRSEIKDQLARGSRTNTKMNVNYDNALKLGLIFDAPPERKKVRDEQRTKGRAIERELAA